MTAPPSPHKFVTGLINLISPVTYAHTCLQHNCSRLRFTLQSSRGALLNCLWHQRTIYVLCMYHHTIAGIKCICNILGQELVCGVR